MNSSKTLLLAMAIASPLAAGQSAPVPVYDFTIHDRTDEVRTVEPSPIVVLEGILVLWEPRLRNRFGTGPDDHKLV